MIELVIGSDNSMLLRIIRVHLLNSHALLSLTQAYLVQDHVSACLA